MMIPRISKRVPLASAERIVACQARGWFESWGRGDGSLAAYWKYGEDGGAFGGVSK